MQYPENHPSAGDAVGILTRQTFAPRRGGPQVGPSPAEQGLPLFLVRVMSLNWH